MRVNIGEPVTRGLGVAIVGSFGVGLLESTASALVVSRSLGEQAIPLRLLVAVFGQNSLTHLLVWSPVVLSIGLLVSILKRRQGSGSVAMLAAAFIVLSGTTVILGDLVVPGRGSRFTILGSELAIALAAVTTYGVLRWAGRCWRPRRMRQVGGAVTGLCLLIIVGAAIVFWRSPLYDADGWRAAQSACPEETARQSHVLWIVVDTTRAEKMWAEVDGQAVMPFLQKWSEEALTCDLAIGNGMWTVPSHASMFTGLAPRRHGTGHAHLHLDDEFETVAEILADSGYATGLVSANPFVGPLTNSAQGFTSVQMTCHLQRLERFSFDYLHEWFGWTPLLPWFDGDYGAALAVDAIDRWLDVNPGRPKFLFVNLMEAHVPYKVPMRYRRMFMDEQQMRRSYALRRRAHGNLVQTLDLQYNLVGPEVIPPADRAVLRRQYCAALRYLDDRVAELIRMFEVRGLLDQTLVIIASDHGEHLGNHGLWAHRFLAYQDLAHVVMMVRRPGEAVPRRMTEPTQLTDLFTTVHAFALPAADPPVRPNARDLFAVMDEETPERVAICEYKGPSPLTLKLFEGREDPKLLHQKTPQIAAVSQRYKLMVSASGRTELFDLQRDPTEQVNLASELPQEVERLSHAIDAWRGRTPVYAPSVGDRPGVSSEALRALRSLGYVGESNGGGKP